MLETKGLLYLLLPSPDYIQNIRSLTDNPTKYTLLTESGRAYFPER